MHKRSRWQMALVTAAVALGLVACGDDGGNAAGLSCKSLAPLVGGANTETNCVGGCTIRNEQSVKDGNFGSAATLQFDGSGNGSVAASVKANGGGMFAAGTQVGVIWSAAAASQSGVVYQLNTYLAGTMQDSFVLGGNGDGTTERPIVHYTTTATRPYDSVEFKYLRTAGTTTGSSFVYELCAD